MLDRRYRILIVDDSEGLCETLSIRLTRDGYAVERAYDGGVALALVRAEKFDLVLLDIRMPGLSGFEVLASIRQLRAMLELPVIMLSGLDDTTEVVRALQSGANDYVTKPVDFGILSARIKSQLTLRHLKELNDKLLSIASHDLKKPLFVMRDIALNLQNELPPTTLASHREALALLLQSVDYMQKLVEESLDLRAIESGHIKLARVPTNINEIARQTIERNTDYARKKNISLRAELAQGLPSVKADDIRLAQVLDNLVGNAIKFSPAGAAACVRTRVERGAIVLEVSDNGPGLNAEDSGQLFTEYAHLHNRPTGGEKSTGLGLAICKELIHLHGGEIGARNNDGGGSTFWFRLPAP